MLTYFFLSKFKTNIFSYYFIVFKNSRMNDFWDTTCPVTQGLCYLNQFGEFRCYRTEQISPTINILILCLTILFLMACCK